MLFQTSVLSVCFVFCSLDITVQGKAGQFNLANSSIEAGMKLYGEEMKKNTGNLLFSPFSIQTALSMVMLGSKGSTLQQLLDLFRESGSKVPVTVTGLKKTFGSVMPTFKSNENYTINSANSVFLQEKTKILEGFSSDLEKYFLTSTKTADFSKAQESADMINGFVEEATKEKIKNLVSPDMFSSLTTMVLVNALYFKGAWTDKFHKSKTRKHPFHKADNTTVQVDFMYKDAYLDVGMYGGREIICLPYAGDRFSMYLFLPHQYGRSEPLSVLEEALVKDPQNLAKALDKKNFFKQDRELLLPRFRIEATMDLKENLESLGVRSPFTSGEADFSGITGSRNLVISDAMHKSFLEVNEEGSEAAAATGLVAMVVSVSLPAHLDRPFIFFIKDEMTGAVLFQGRVADPSS